jgi:DNA-binding beta-propeller fold protein YncE
MVSGRSSRLSGRRRPDRIAALLLAALLAGCAAPRVLRLEPAAGAAPVWPPADSAEPARYRYLGQLTGEANLVIPDGARDWRAGLRWLAGLDEAGAHPTVLQRPMAGLVDARGRILVSDVSRAAVFVFDPQAGRLDLWEDAAPNQRWLAPIGLAAGLNGELLVSDAQRHAVFRLDAAGRPLGSWGAAQLQRPTGLARDAARGRVFVADTLAHDIKVFDDAGQLLAVWGRDGVDGTPLNQPTHLVWAAETLHVTDSLNARIVRFDAEGRALGAFGRRGRQVGDLVRPKGVAVDAAGRVLVVESLHDHLLVFDRAEQGHRLLLALGGTGAAPGQFYLPAGLWLDAQGRVYVADMMNGRVAVLQFLGAP